MKIANSGKKNLLFSSAVLQHEHSRQPPAGPNSIFIFPNIFLFHPTRSPENDFLMKLVALIIYDGGDLG